MAVKRRHKMLAFYGVETTDTTQTPPVTTTTFHRMRFFTQFSQNKNPQEYARKYVDEENQRTDVVGYAPSISYAFDRSDTDPVLADIVAITDSEAVGAAAVRTLILVDTETGKAIRRDYAVIPSSEGDDANTYTHAGDFKANGEKIPGTAATTDGWSTCTFEEEE